MGTMAERDPNLDINRTNYVHQDLSRGSTLIDDNNDNREATPTPRDHIRGSGHNLIALTKLYIDEKKYGGHGDSFEYKYGIFLDLCKKAELPL